MTTQSDPGNDSPSPVLQRGNGTQTVRPTREHRRVSKFNRFMITWAVFAPLTLPFMKGEFWQSAVPQAIGGALFVAGVAWVVTIAMKPTRVALASTLCVAFALYAISMAGRFLGQNADRNVSSAAGSAQAAIPTKVRESLEKTARQINSQAPIRVDKYTVLNSASFSGKSIIYRNALEVELSDEEFRGLLRDIRPLTVENFRRNASDARAFAEYGIVAIYQYTDKSGKVMNLELDFAKDPDLVWARQ